MVFETGGLGDVIVDNEALENLTEADINDKLECKEMNISDVVASTKLAKFESELGEKFNFQLSRMPESNEYYLVDKESMESIAIPYSLDELSGLFDTLKTIIEQEGDIVLVGTTNTRAIHKVNLMGRASGEALMSIVTPFDGDNQLNINTAASNNNKVEEIYRFTQMIQGIPESEWNVEDFIMNDSGPIGINQDIKKEEG